MGADDHQRLADPDVQKRIQSLQFHDASVDLGQVMTGNYGKFVYGLQVVVETKDGLNEIRPSVLAGWRTMIIRAAPKKNWRLCRIGLLSNHIHVLLGPDVTQAPADVALSLMNNLAFAQVPEGHLTGEFIERFRRGRGSPARSRLYAGWICPQRGLNQALAALDQVRFERDQGAL